MANKPTLLTRAEVVRSAAPSAVNTATMSAGMAGLQEKVKADYATKKIAAEREKAALDLQNAIDEAGGIEGATLPKRKVNVFTGPFAQAYNERVRNLTLIKAQGNAQRHSDTLAHEAMHQGSDGKTFDPEYYRAGMDAYISAQVKAFSANPSFADVVADYQSGLSKLREVQYTGLVAKKQELVHSEVMADLDKIRHDTAKLLFDVLGTPITPEPGESYTDAAAKRAEATRQFQVMYKEFVKGLYGDFITAEQAEAEYEKQHDEFTDNFFRAINTEARATGNVEVYNVAREWYNSGDLYYINKEPPAWVTSGDSIPYVGLNWMPDLNSRPTMDVVLGPDGNPMQIQLGSLDPNDKTPYTMTIQRQYTDENGVKHALNFDYFISADFEAFVDKYSGDPDKWKRAREEVNATYLYTAMRYYSTQSDDEWVKFGKQLEQSAFGTAKSGEFSIENIRKKYAEINKIRRAAKLGGNLTNIVSAWGVPKKSITEIVDSSADTDPNEVRYNARQVMVDSGLSDSDIDEVIPHPGVVAAATLAKEMSDNYTMTNAAFPNTASADRGNIKFFDDAQLGGFQKDINNLLSSNKPEEAMKYIDVVVLAGKMKGYSKEDTLSQFKDPSLGLQLFAYAPTAQAQELAFAAGYTAPKDVEQAYDEAMRGEAYTPPSNLGVLKTNDAMSVAEIARPMERKLALAYMGKNGDDVDTAVAKAKAVLNEISDSIDVAALANGQVVTSGYFKNATAPLKEHLSNAVRPSTGSNVKSLMSTVFGVGNNVAASNIRPEYSRRGPDLVMVFKEEPIADGLVTKLRVSRVPQARNQAAKLAAKGDLSEYGLPGWSVVAPKTSGDDFVLVRKDYFGVTVQGQKEFEVPVTPAGVEDNIRGEIDISQQPTRGLATGGVRGGSPD